MLGHRSLTLSANSACQFNEDFLRTQTLEMLQGLDALAVNKQDPEPPRILNYAGQATTNPTAVVANSSLPGTKIEDEAPLVMKPCFYSDQK